MQMSRDGITLTDLLDQVGRRMANPGYLKSKAQVCISEKDSTPSPSVLLAKVSLNPPKQPLELGIIQRPVKELKLAG